MDLADQPRGYGFGFGLGHAVGDREGSGERAAAGGGIDPDGGAIEHGGDEAGMFGREGILLRPITRDYIKSLRGRLKGKGVMKAMMEDRKRERNL